MKKLRRDVWNTYATYPYTHDVANDQRSAGGVHLHQVKRARSGWQERIVQSNGSFEAAGPVSPISDADGEAKFATAEQEARR
jgi:hypothetical protein